MKEWLRKIQMIAMLALLAVPPGLVLGTHAFADRLWIPLLFSLVCFAAGSVCLIIPGRWRVACGLMLSAGLIALGLYLLPWRPLWWTLMLPLGCAALLLYMLPIAGWGADQELSHSMTIGGCGVFLAVQLLNMLPSGVYIALGTPLKMTFLLYAALWMFALNRQSLIDAAARGQRAPVGMRRRNKVFTVALIAIVLLITSIPVLAQALAWLWDRLIEAAVWLGRLLAGLMPESAGGGGSGGGADLSGLGAEMTEPGLFVRLMEKIFAVLAVAGLAVALFFALRVVGRKLRVLFSRLWTMLNRYAQAAGEDYVDEVVDTRDTGESDVLRRKPFWKDWFDQVNEDRLNPVERIRYRYRRLVRRHQEWLPGSTARETLPPEAAEVYERARYSSAPVTPEEAQAFAEAAKTMEKN